MYESLLFARWFADQFLVRLRILPSPCGLLRDLGTNLVVSAVASGWLEYVMVDTGAEILGWIGGRRCIFHTDVCY